MLGPMLMVPGSEEQKAEHIPKILSGEVVWAQGYSEPGSGSTSPRCRPGPSATATTT